MILYDTNVLIDILKGKAECRDRDVCLCGMVCAELLHGAVSEKDRNRIMQFIRQFPILPFTEKDWIETGSRMYTLRTHGISVPTNDVIIYQTCASQKVALRTRDQHFLLMNDLFGEVTIYGI
jgi:predicted nucleic acid-binding protein